jgi:hypothetical protein
LRCGLGILLLSFNDLHLMFHVSPRPIPFLWAVLPVSKLMDQLIILEVSWIWGFASYSNRTRKWISNKPIANCFLIRHPEIYNLIVKSMDQLI